MFKLDPFLANISNHPFLNEWIRLRFNDRDHVVLRCMAAIVAKRHEKLFKGYYLWQATRPESICKEMERYDIVSSRFEVQDPVELYRAIIAGIPKEAFTNQIFEIDESYDEDDNKVEWSMYFHPDFLNVSARTVDCKTGRQCSWINWRLYTDETPLPEVEPGRCGVEF